jgi:hypothetical protein
MTPTTHAVLAASLLFLCPAAALACGGPLCEDHDDSVAEVSEQDVEPVVDMVICLDTSGSMEGLLDACRRKLWDVATLVAQAQPEPRLRVALLTYGGEANPDGGFVVVHTGFTDDLDVVYERLMLLRAGGGTELVGRALHTSLETLEWSSDERALRMIFVAGNESADQDPVYRLTDMCQQALQSSVVVHGIYCTYQGDDGAVQASWQQLAEFGGGELSVIDPETGTVAVVTPYDEELARLGGSLNETYLPYGSDGGRGYENQARQDQNAADAGGLSTAASRAECKASGVYRNGAWDLVDARQADDFDWAAIAEDDLPQALRGLSVEERDASLAELQAQREGIQAQIRSLSVERQRFVQAELERQGGAERSLDTAMLRAIQAQAETCGLRFGE